MGYETILFEQEGSVGILKFNRPNVLNALNKQVFSELILVLDAIEKERMPKVLTLTGTGEKAFIAGTDIAEMENLTSFEARVVHGKKKGRIE